MRPMTRDEIEDLGFRRILCRRCGYRGWSEDTGGCPRCVAREEDHRAFDKDWDAVEKTQGEADHETTSA